MIIGRGKYCLRQQYRYLKVNASNCWAKETASKESSSDTSLPVSVVLKS